MTFDTKPQKSIFQPEIYLYFSPTHLLRTQEKGQRGLKLLQTIVHTSAQAWVRDLELSQASKKGPGRPKTWESVARIKAKARS